MFSDSQLNPDLSSNQNQANGNISLNENRNGNSGLIATSNMPSVLTLAEEGQTEGHRVSPCSTSTATFSDPAPAPVPAPGPVVTQMEAEVPTSATGQINAGSDLTVPALQAGQDQQPDLRLQNAPAPVDNNSIDNIEIDIIDLNASNSSGSSNSASSSSVGSSGDTANSVVSLNFNESSNSSAPENPLPSINTIMNGSVNGGGNEIREISVNQNHNGDAIQIISIQQVDENPERAESRNPIIPHNNLSPENNGNNDIDIFNNQNQAQNPAPQIAAAGFDEQAEEFRRRFFQAILRRDAQPVESPPEYEEFDEDDNIDLIEDIADDDTYDGVSTGPPSPREDRGDSDEHGLVEREEISSVPVFDLQLPTRHSYLGDEMEALHGRTIMEGGAIAQIPLVLLDFHLVPGQTLPLTVFHAVTQSALRNCVPNHRHFGIVHSGLNDSHIRAPLPRRALGTTAEIYEFQEEREAPFRLRHRQPPSVNIKAKGRHRFNVLSTYRQSDGHLVAKVKIRPEINLPKFWRNITSPGHRHLFPGTGSSSGSVVHSSIKGCASSRRRSSSSSSIPAVKRRGKSPAPTASKSQTHVALADSSVSVAVDDSSDSEMRAEESHGLDEDGPGSSPAKSQNPEPTTTGSGKGTKSILTELSGRLEVNRKKTKYYSAMMSWPYFVYEQFDEEVLVEKIHRKLNTELSSLVAARVVVPQDATDLSFWLAQNLTMSDDLRLQMLKMDTPIERLRFANKLLDKVSRVIECNQCQGHHGQGVIANHSDIFSMSVEGPQGTYVNPHGCVHELITVTKIRGIVYRGHPSTESSWFPGYSWRICECRTCGNHIGWKFEAVEKLKPTKFWGLARRSVSFKYDFSIENDCPDLDAPATSAIPNTNPSSNNNNNHRNNNNNTVLRRNVSESSQDNEVI